jgi:phage terminase large subunit
MTLHTDLRALRTEVGDLVASHGRARSLDAFARYADDPVGFILEELGADPQMFWSRQREIAELVRDQRYVVVRSCNGLGKDWLAGRLALWWVYSRRGYVLITGPTERQVKHVVMGQVRRAFNAAGDLPGSLYELALRLEGSEEMGILAFTSTDASKLTGFHAPRLMVLITEAQGIEPLVWEGAFSNVTGAESRIVAVGNPLQPEGKFYEVSRSPSWAAVKIAATEHPNVVQRREVVPGAVTQEFIDLMVQEYGVGSGVYQSRVMGEFPEDSDEALCQRSWITTANERWAALPHGLSDGEVVLALDPARYGPDFSALAVRRGDVIEEIVTWSKLSTVETAGRVIVEMDRLGLPKDHRVTVDEPGLGGGVIDVLREMGVPTWGYNGGAAPREPEKFRNLRAESFWRLRRRLERGEIALPPDAKLADELCSMRWSIGLDGRVVIESKDELRARIGRSPDRADAVAIVFSGRRTRWWLGPVERGAA